MSNFHFKVVRNDNEANIYILGDCYENALDILFSKYSFDNYEFEGIKNFCS